MNIYYSPSRNKIYTRSYIYFETSNRKMLDFILKHDNKTVYKIPKDLVYIGEW